MSEWRSATVGEVARLDVETTEVIADRLYPIVGVLNRGRGLLLRDSIRGSDTAYKTLYLVRPGQIVYSRLKAFEGAITVVPRSAGEAFASQEFPTFTCSADLMPEFFRLLTTTPELWNTLQKLSTGMGGRRERVKPAAFLTIPVGIPPLAEQRRIVTVMAAVGAQIETLENEVERASAVTTSFIEDAVAGVELTPLGSVLLGIEGGRSPQAIGRTPGSQERGVLKVSAVRTQRFLPEESKALMPDTVMPSHSEVRGGDLLITRANTPALVGQVCLVPKDVRSGLYLSDKTLRMIPDRLKADPGYLEAVLALPDVRKWLGGSATGTSASMLNISHEKIRQTPVPVFDIGKQCEVAATVAVTTDVIASLSAELAALRTMRANLLTALLSQEITVDAAVDKFVKAA